MFDPLIAVRKNVSCGNDLPPRNAANGGGHFRRTSGGSFPEIDEEFLGREAAQTVCQELRQSEILRKRNQFACSIQHIGDVRWVAIHLLLVDRLELWLDRLPSPGVLQN